MAVEKISTNLTAGDGHGGQLRITSSICIHWYHVGPIGFVYVLETLTRSELSEKRVKKVNINSRSC